MQTHAANPFAWPLDDGTYKVYFTSRDKDNRSHISYLILDMNIAPTVVEVGQAPVLVPGSPGLFDDSGVAVGYLIEVNHRIFLYYLGWNLKVTVPWMNTIGLAISEDGGEHFEKASRAPIMDRSDEDPFSISYPSLMNENGLFRMWYGSNLSWGERSEDMKHIVKHARSDDGVHWNRNHDTVLDHEHPNEYAISKPCVINNGSFYEMWYSFRGGENGDHYSIGYATSYDGLNWERRDKNVGISVSESGWDSEMIEYPFVFFHQGEKYMLYNGNGYGRTGFGLAIYNQ